MTKDNASGAGMETIAWQATQYVPDDGERFNCVSSNPAYVAMYPCNWQDLVLRTDATRLLAESQAHNAKLEAQVERLRDVATGKIKHVFNGLCPDEIEGPDVRDPDCVACQILDAALKP